MSSNLNNDPNKGNGSAFFDNTKREPRPIPEIKKTPAAKPKVSYSDDSEKENKVAGTIIPIIAVLMILAVVGGVFYFMNPDMFSKKSSSKKPTRREREDDDDDDDDRHSGSGRSGIVMPGESDLNAALDAAGAGTGDITISLAWYNSDDVDLHVRTPNGSELYYGNRNVQNGTLDVDANAEVMMDEPVENIYFTNPASGTYEVWIEDYYDHNQGYTSYIVRITVDGHSRLYEGHIDGTGSEVDILTFGYND